MRLSRALVSLVLLTGVIALVGFYSGISGFLDELGRLSIGSAAAVLLALVANAFAAAFRFKCVAAEIEYPIGFRHALATVAAGSLGGLAFFQIAGQLMARGVVAGRAEIPFAATAVITAYERFAAAIVSALFALGGAFFIFGKLSFDLNAGGNDLIKVLCGLIAAGTAGALMGYGRKATAAISPLLTRHFLLRCLAIIGLTLLVHIPMLMAYVIAASALSPQTAISDLIAASALVMFATGVPISLAGWGIREMSAIAALGVIGVSAHAALITAVTIGTGSTLVLGIVGATLLPSLMKKQKRQPAEDSATKKIDYYRVLAWVLPVSTAGLVLFQIYVPVGSGLLNVNLADPIAILGGVFFILALLRSGRMPHWRVSHVNFVVGLTALILGVSLLIGSARFGWTTWALVNRFLGWFVLLAYGATGALIVRESREEGFYTILLTFVGATAAVAALEVILALLASLGLPLPVVLGAIQGFSQNHNFFAFQLLMAMSVAIAVMRGDLIRTFVLAILMAGLWFSGSRSGWIAAISVIGAAFYVGRINVREIATAAACVAFVAASQAIIAATPQIVPTEASTQERLISIFGGLDLFFAHPIFGAGLGAFRNEMILGSSGIPLLIHSTAVWLLAELGLVGLAVFAIPFIRIFLKEFPFAKRGEHASLLIVLSFVAFAVMSAPADMLYQRTFWLIIGCCLALPLQGANRGC